MAIVLYEALGVVVLVDWMTGDPTWTSVVLYAGLGVEHLEDRLGELRTSPLALDWVQVAGDTLPY